MDRGRNPLGQACQGRLWRTMTERGWSVTSSCPSSLANLATNLCSSPEMFTMNARRSPSLLRQTVPETANRLTHY